MQVADRQLRTEYSEHAHQVGHQVHELHEARASSCRQVNEYQAMLSVAAQEDLGATYRIEELERRCNLAESGANHTYEKGMEMKREYVNEKNNRQNGG